MSIWSCLAAEQFARDLKRAERWGTRVVFC